jgi:hypothetical protein
MSPQFTITIDAVDPTRLARFWAEALGYAFEGPPEGSDRWTALWKSRGVPAAELEVDEPSLRDPTDRGPRLWFQKVDDRKVGKNRVHLDLHVSGGFAVPRGVRKARIDAEAHRLVLLGAVHLGVHESPGVDFYAVAMQDPEGNEFDLN